MPLAPGIQLGHYEIIAPIGAGGMGEVYRARDTVLKREVAVKILPDSYSSDPERLRRFRQEAEAAASLNHPNILTVHQVGRQDSTSYLITELLQGETLREKLRRGPLPVRTTVDYAVQIAHGLDTAHENCIVHRDLKPENLFITKDGRVKILDFGLAKLTHPELDPLASTQAVINDTTPGAVMGTVGYMSPEQVRGQAADPRSDIFAFGAVLFEMLTGKRAFQGTTYADTVSAVLHHDPPISELTANQPPGLQRIISRCLQKNREQRFHSAADLAFAIEALSDAPSAIQPAVPVGNSSPLRWGKWGVAARAAGLAVVLLVASLVWIAVYLRNEPSSPAMVRFQIPAPDKLNFYFQLLPAVSPDGQRIAFAASSTPFNFDARLFVRALNAATATEIPTSGSSAGFPFWSPDSQQIAFTSNGTLQRVDLSGGPPVTICSDCNAANGGTWNRDGVILITNRTTRTLIRLSVAGGEAKPLHPLATGEAAQMWPEFLPDGKHYLYLSIGKAPYQQGIYAASLDSNDRTFLVATNTNAAYLQSGQLLFTHGGTLMVQPFDIGSLKLSGEPHPVADHIESGATRSTLSIATFAASPNGVILWRHDNRSSPSSLQWLDRSGKALGVVGEAADYSNPALSPDESKLAVSIRDPQTKTRDIWIFDLVRGGKTRLTFDPADDLDCIWSPDGKRIAFTSDRAGQRNLYWKLADGSGPDELLLAGKEGGRNLVDWSRDGKYLIYFDDLTPHLYVLSLDGDRKPVPFINTPFFTQQGQFSPNDRWVAYRSPESGRNEVFVQGFNLDPSQPRGKWQISSEGGELPRWRGDGKELFFHFTDSFFAVDVKTDGPTFTAGVPKRLFDIPGVSASATHGEYLVTRDGQRFLVATASEKAAAQPIEVVVNWR